MNEYRAGIDIGSTTVKLVVLDGANKIIFSEYRRHCSHTQATLCALLTEAKQKLGDCLLSISITGSGGIGISNALNINFVQEVVATCGAIRCLVPQTDVAIELGGEDAKIIYFGSTVEERMNGVCAGGTGSFIDQMAALLQTDAQGLNNSAKDYKTIYPIAARCGVFAKTDIQPLINEGATKPDLAASIFQAVVNQTISGLAQGKPIRGTVTFLGGPLHYLSELKNAFIRTLHLTEQTALDPQNSHLFAALGAALVADRSPKTDINELIELLNKGIKLNAEIKRLPPLFESESEYKSFCLRHEKATVKRGCLSEYKGDCFLGIDAGSTTTKLALISSDGELLFEYYANNEGNPVQTAITAMRKLRNLMPPSAKIVRACSTGYGESLLKTAFCLDEGEVETVAHSKAAAFFDSKVDCVLDIGGQDMKFVKLKDGFVDSVTLNEACSSGCGSFIENFANSLGLSVTEFAKAALLTKGPVDLGTRCTVFMNSKVKQAQKEGVSVNDISAGLAYSVVKNALYKVIKLTDPSQLGRHIVVQGGTFHNHAVLRALEKIAGIEVICPNISGIMGAFGAALIAKDHYTGEATSMLPMDEICALTYKTNTARCKGCSNNCMLTVNIFSGERKHITGNRCEKGAGTQLSRAKGENLVEYKRRRIFDYEPLPASDAIRGEIGIPRVLNIYENYPFWATFFKALRFRVILSPESSRELYELGIESIPSESECYPAKLAHGHVQWLINNGVKSIFHPCVFYERQEIKGAKNHFNCPIVVSYPENLKNNVDDLAQKNVEYICPFIAFTDMKTIEKELIGVCERQWKIPRHEVSKAVSLAWNEQLKAKADIRDVGKANLDKMRSSGRQGIVLAGRPYHIDHEINHGIAELIASYGFDVFTEDSLPIDFEPQRPLRVVDQWTYHSRLYTAAEFVSKSDDLELIQLNSFGCGLDAVTTDQVSEILEKNNKLYTVLKIDEVNNLGAVRIRIRSLIAAMNIRRKKGIMPQNNCAVYKRSTFTKDMKKSGYTILAPQMSPIHFDIIGPVFKKYGYNIEILRENKSAVDIGLQYVNNDACYPSIVTVGQIMEAVLSGRYDTKKLAIIMTQTGGCCRASNYVAFIRRALDKAGLSYIPVISLNANGMEKNSGFKLSLPMLFDAIKAIVYGDLLMRCLYRVRPYEKETGSANALCEKQKLICIRSLTDKNSEYSYKDVCHKLVSEFDDLPIDETVHKPRVGVVGEILVKYMPLANNHLVELLEKEGAEAVVPDLMDFLNYSFYNQEFKHENYYTGSLSYHGSILTLKAIDSIRKPAVTALSQSKRFEPPLSIEAIADMTKPFLSLGNQYGEGWFLAGEMIELLQGGTKNIVCIQPFACLPNHVVGKGVIKSLKQHFPFANIVAIDYDPGASEVNQLNRIKLMLSETTKPTDQHADQIVNRQSC